MDGAQALRPIHVDARKVKQIVYNLLSNAVKFTGEGGHVTLRADCVSRADVGRTSGSWPSRRFPLADCDFPEFLELGVIDTGIGISPEGLEHLFTPFSQIDTGLARKFEGTGLGLAMVKLLAELHGGTMAVESAVGEGSRFTVWLPMRPGETLAPVKTPAHDIHAAPGTRTALVVEDDYNSADVIRVQLAAEGFEVLHATSAETALDFAAQQSFSLITIDVLLPDMDGWALLRRLKEMPAVRRTPVVIISIVADRAKGFALGAAAVMQKPISRQELCESLGAVGLLPFSHHPIPSADTA
jgi:CheY-like chemotaxis protein